MLARLAPVVVHDSRWPDVTGTTTGDVVVLAHGGEHAPMAARLGDRGLHVVTVGDSLEDTRALLAGRTSDGPTIVVGPPGGEPNDPNDPFETPPTVAEVAVGDIPLSRILDASTGASGSAPCCGSSVAGSVSG